MCFICEQRAILDGICEEHTKDGVKPHVVMDTDISSILIIGDEAHEDHLVIKHRATIMLASIRLNGMQAVIHRGNFKPQWFITALYNMNPGSNPSLHKH